MDIHALTRWQNPGGQRCLEATGLPWGARSPTFKIQGSGFDVAIFSPPSFQISAFQLFNMASDHCFPLSDLSFQLSAFQRFSFSPSVLWSVVRGSNPAFRFQISAFQRFSFSARVPSCQRLKSSL